MVRVITTKCGKEITRSMAYLDFLSRQNMENALVGCGTLDDEGNYIEIESLSFIF